MNHGLHIHSLFHTFSLLFFTQISQSSSSIHHPKFSPFVETSTYQGNNTLPSTHHGSDHDLNLSLGISTTSVGEGSSRNENSEQPHLNYTHATRRLQMENPVSTAVGMPALKGLPLTSGHSPTWNGVYPTFVPNYEGSGTNSRTIGGCSQGPPNWGWQVQGHNHIPIPTAASSGFSATSGTHHHSMAAAAFNNHCFPVTTSSQYYYQIRPQTPPPPP